MDNNTKATKQFGLTLSQAKTIETLVTSVPAEFRPILRFALVVGSGEIGADKPFQDIAHNILKNHGKGV